MIFCGVFLGWWWRLNKKPYQRIEIWIPFYKLQMCDQYENKKVLSRQSSDSPRPWREKNATRLTPSGRNTELHLCQTGLQPSFETQWMGFVCILIGEESYFRFYCRCRGSEPFRGRFCELAVYCLFLLWISIWSVGRLLDVFFGKTMSIKIGRKKKRKASKYFT